MLLHANPYLGKIFIIELDPQKVYTYQNQIRFVPGTNLRLQLVDHLIVVHNLDEKTTQLHDLRIPNYHQPLLRPNLSVDQKFLESSLTDCVFPEEIC